MEIFQLNIAIAKYKSISKASEKLYITQSALNQQLLSLEKYFGAPFFIRNKNNWEITEVGRIYIESSRDILQIENSMTLKIQDAAKTWKNRITIGLPPERGVKMFTAVYPTIHKKYPNVVFQPIELEVETQSKMMLSGELDIGFQTISELKYKQLSYIKILREPFYLCIPKTHRLAYTEAFLPYNYPKISLSLFKDDQFTLVRRTSSMRYIIDNSFKDAGFSPELIFESTSMSSMQHLCETGICCSIIPRFYAIKSNHVCYFSLGPSVGWDLYCVYNKNSYLSKPIKDFITMATDYWNTHFLLD
ncbi:MAG: LysR family transcriptional regulator [Lachnospirales bacterium]